MENQATTLSVQWVRVETGQMRLISLNGNEVWPFVPGQVAVLGVEGVGESYFAIASAPEDRHGLDFLIRKGEGVSGALFEVKKGDLVQGRLPRSKGFPIDQYRGRDFLLAAVGSAIAPMRSVLRSVSYRQADFGKMVLVYGARRAEDVPFAEEMKDWQQSGMEVVLTLSGPETGEWHGKTGHVQEHFREALAALHQPMALICGMKAMTSESRDELIRLGVAENEILTNY
jgi:sulfhydrogenase subunit gamma (sulfur reductase)